MDKLTVKQAKFVKGVVEGKTKQRAGIDAGYSGSPATVSVTVSEVLKNPKVQEAIQDEMARQGITLEKIIRPITRALDDKSVEVQLKGHDRAMRIITPKNDPAQPSIHFHNHQAKQKERYGL